MKKRVANSLLSDTRCLVEFFESYFVALALHVCDTQGSWCDHMMSEGENMTETIVSAGITAAADSGRVNSAQLSLRDALLVELSAARREALYHSERRRFFTATSRYMTFFMLVSTSSAVVLYSGGEKSHFVQLCGLAAAFLFAFDLLVGPMLVAFKHESICRQYLALEKSIIRFLKECNSDPSLRDALEEIHSSRLDIQVEEPPQKRWLSIWAHNQVVLSQGQGHIYKINRFQLAIANYYDLFSVSHVKVMRSLP
jgi:hypothetical protein